jgi:glycosyltransferase 2 family protein
VTRSRLLRFVVAIGLTAYVLWQSDPSKVLAAAASANLRWIGAAVGLVLIDRTLMALRWIDLLSALTPGSRPRFPVVVRIFFVSSFVSNFVPSVAADMYRAYALARHDVHLAESTASVLMDRILGVLSMVIVGAIAVPFARDVGLHRGMVLALGLAMAACVAAGMLVFSERAASTVVGLTASVRWPRLQRITASLVDAVRRYASHRTELTRVLVMSVLVQALRIAQAWCLGCALGITLPLLTYFALMPVILLVMQVPITINGLGTTQGAFKLLFGAMGVPAAPVFTLSVLFLALGIAGSLPGALLYAAGDNVKIGGRTTDFPTPPPLG